MAEKINNVIDVRTDSEGNPLKDLVIYDHLSNKATARFSPYTFKSFGSIMRLTNQQLSIIIREYYQKIFHDLKGVYIGYQAGQRSPFNVVFYFTKNIAEMPEGKIRNIDDLSKVDKNANMFLKNKALQNKINGNIYAINDDTKVLLSEIMYGGKNEKSNNPKSNKWKQCTISRWIPSNDAMYRPGAGELWIGVHGCFDIRLILKKIFEDTMITYTKYNRSADGSYDAENFTAACMYEARFVKWVNPNVFVMNIEQFDAKAVAEFAIADNPQMQLANGFIYY